MRAHLANAWYGLLDYAAFPVTMVVVAPVLLRHLGTSGYGILAFSMAAVNTGAIIASGFADANIQQIATARAERNTQAIHETVRCTLGIHLLMGSAVALLALLFTPWLALRVAAGEPSALRSCIAVLRISSVLVLLRTVETVAVSTQRAFEAYGEAVRVSATIRVIVLIVAAVLAWNGRSIEVIVVGMGTTSLAGTAVQVFKLGQQTSFVCLSPTLQGEQTRALLRFGSFTWLLAVGGVIFSQVDRLLIGISMGSTAVAEYSLAAQLTQPIGGSTAAALHFLFPHFSQRATHAGIAAIRRPVLIALGCNALMVILQAVPLLLFGHWILKIWAGRKIAEMNAHILPLLVIASALTALSVTGNYAMLALGRVRIATVITLGSGCVMLLAAAPLMARWSGTGMAAARLICGAASLLIYLPLRSCFTADLTHEAARVTLATPAQRGVLP
jgi:O-antigen/teichoic acid export membrane protein